MNLGAYKTREELTNLFEEKRLLNKGVEIGSHEGFFAKSILEKWSGKLYLIDIWNEISEKEYNYHQNKNNYHNIINKCVDNINNHQDRCFLIRATSLNAFDLFNDESLDFVYIDANHQYDFIKQDISLWYPKVRKGGVVAGHDYLKIDWYTDPNFHENKKDKHIWASAIENNNEFPHYAGLFGVNPAVDEFCSEINTKFYTTEEWFGSWYFIK
jgi:hypothetical protein